MKKEALVFLNDATHARKASDILEAAGYFVFIATAASEVEGKSFSIGVTDRPLAGPDSIKAANKALSRIPRWAYWRKDELFSQETQRANGIVAEFTNKAEFYTAIEHAERCVKDPVFGLMDALESITGVQLKKAKRALVESRLNKRAEEIGLKSVEQYAEYFHSHAADELSRAISLITTHTTHFFREEEHFDYVFDHVFPKITQRKFRIWSAASSTGQEVYSLAIAAFEYARANDLKIELEVLGTDIDQNSVNYAREGIYKQDQIESLSPEIIKRYFDQGTGELSGYYRVKDFVHTVCRFERLNLMADSYLSVAHEETFDFAFLRNAMIYFEPSDVAAIVTKVSRMLKTDGLLFLGHSESLANLVTPYKQIGNSIYALAKSSPRAEPTQTFETADGLFVIGASTGGVEALKVVLEEFRPGCAPILIVQHIPNMFSAALAKRLNETCKIAVSEAVNGEVLKPSHAYIAPGGKQMKLVQRATGFTIEINDDPPMGLHKPSVDYLFKSVAPLVSKTNVAAAILTGMGRDGAQGLKELRDAGAYTIAQDEATSVVFGMPGAAVELRAASEVLPLDMIASRLQMGLRRRKVA